MVDGSLARVRARLLQEVALASDAREVSGETDGSGALKTLKTSLEYLEKRQAQIRYAQFQAEG